MIVVLVRIILLRMSKQIHKNMNRIRPCVININIKRDIEEIK
jgi:hypothetical protein